MAFFVTLGHAAAHSAPCVCRFAQLQLYLRPKELTYGRPSSKRPPLYAARPGRSRKGLCISRSACRCTHRLPRPNYSTYTQPCPAPARCHRPCRDARFSSRLRTKKSQIPHRLHPVRHPRALSHVRHGQPLAPAGTHRLCCP